MSFFKFALKDIKGNLVNFGEFQNNARCFLVVNVASKCGLTKSNYTSLIKLDEQFGNKGLKILAFPCNQFGAQEPGSAEEICQFVRDQWKAQFPIFEKIDVNGPNTSEFYQFLKSSKAFQDGNK